jgi:hypothetical protein
VTARAVLVRGLAIGYHPAVLTAIWSRLTVLAVGIIAAALGFGCLSAPTGTGPEADSPDVAELRRRAGRTEDLGWLAAAAGPHPWLRPGMTRSQLVRDKHRSHAAGDAVGAARAAGVLAAEAQVRATRVLDAWLGRIDPETGLLPKGPAAEDQVWDYANAGADLYPHLVIAAALLRPTAEPVVLQILSSERAIAQPGRLPQDVDLASNRVKEGTLEDRIYGAVEYAKDALLPLTERLGGEPWLGRMQELARAVDEAAEVKTPFGPIPAEKSEVNGQALQVLSRLYWATGDEVYRASAERIARAYLELALPSTDWLPTRTWDFKRKRPSTQHLQLRDHGNEVVAGLVEFHLIETVRGEPRASEHGAQLRAMLDRLLEVGRSPEGLWKSEIDLKTGRSLSYALSDNWGYLYAAYLTQATIEETSSGGDPEAARRYRAAARAGLEAAAQLDLYPWQGVEPDGYADTIEGALYVLSHLASPAAAAWIDRQAGTLFGAQDDDGRVEDGYLDGNFIRTALLYGAWQSQGVRLHPWEPGAMLGAVPDGACLSVAIATGRDWQGRVIFDAPRHRLHLGLPLDYPRLNAWPEWFATEPGHLFRVDDSDGGATGVRDGASLSEGVDLRLEAGAERHLRVCRLD